MNGEGEPGEEMILFGSCAFAMLPVSLSLEKKVYLRAGILLELEGPKLLRHSCLSGNSFQFSLIC